MNNSALEICVPEQAKSLSDDRLFVDFLDVVLQNKQNIHLLQNMLRPYWKSGVINSESLEILDFSYHPYSATGTLLFKHGDCTGSRGSKKDNCISIDFEIDNKLGVFRMIFPKQKEKPDLI